MGARLDEAQRALAERMAAVGVEGGGGGEVQTTFADPDEMIRGILSGFVPVEETEAVHALVDNCGDAMMRQIGQAGSARAMRAAMRTTVAQILALGVALERTEEET